MTAPIKPLSKTAANKLWAHLHEALSDAQSTLQEVIATEAWKPLGYKTFTQAWKARMSDITFPPEAAVQAAYQILAEGGDVPDVVANVKGVGISKAKALKAQKAAGVPAKLAKGRRAADKAPRKHWVHISVDGDELRKWKQVAEANNYTLQDAALEAIRSWMDS
jgi:hypothetical protein